jgi:transcriptional regulator with XRE-family HTH domain
MTLEVLAERAELTPNYIGSVEIGKRDPSLSTILALAKGLGVRPGEFFGTVADLTPSGEEAAHLFDQTPPEVQKAVLALLSSLSKKAR